MKLKDMKEKKKRNEKQKQPLKGCVQKHTTYKMHACIQKRLNFSYN